jgi:hypothetical protein
LAAWILDHDARSHELITRVFDGQPEGLTRDDVLDNITLYWLTNTTVSAARLYWENKLAFFAPKDVAIPVAVSVFPDEIYAAPRSWAERAYPKLIHYNRLDKGGHFAAWEQPELFSEEVRAGFRPLRKEWRLVHGAFEDGTAWQRRIPCSGACPDRALPRAGGRGRTPAPGVRRGRRRGIRGRRRWGALA